MKSSEDTNDFLKKLQTSVKNIETTIKRIDDLEAKKQQ